MGVPRREVEGVFFACCSLFLVGSEVLKAFFLFCKARPVEAFFGFFFCFLSHAPPPTISFFLRRKKGGARRRRCSLSLRSLLLFKLVFFCFIRSDVCAGAQRAHIAPAGSGGREQGASGAGKGERETERDRAIDSFFSRSLMPPVAGFQPSHPSSPSAFLLGFVPPSFAWPAPREAPPRSSLCLQEQRRSKKRRKQTARDVGATRGGGGTTTTTTSGGGTTLCQRSP